MYNSVLLFGHLLIISAVEAGAGGVSFWRENVTMTCPNNGSWFKAGNEVGYRSNSYTLTYNGKNKGLYHCEYGKNSKYYFYVEGKVCTDCFELDATMFGSVIVADVSITIILMILIYKWTQKKSSPGAKAPAGPAPPSPDYKHLNTHRRSQDPYSFINNSKLM
ncbi:T-cell surface glycoprotein CD3 epsilon chain-like [Phyllopteryx taeniolatus]|uniref:T-cell surface glycoprotein CD3 epsilon chain-like n=1 Tax=Phyllopteryx taeniolatus TaxID=161469 RepID=UPI002AD44463|nr:T-cell surface glycoprotein CD3 epsilon chain-like [Phyllopteryx taeniolatus]